MSSWIELDARVANMQWWSVFTQIYTDAFGYKFFSVPLEHMPIKVVEHFYPAKWQDYFALCTCNSLLYLSQ